MRYFFYHFFFFNDTATTEIYTLSLHDALPISDLAPAVADAGQRGQPGDRLATEQGAERAEPQRDGAALADAAHGPRSEEHTSELQSRQYLVCRLLLEKKKQITIYHYNAYVSLQ